MRPQISHHATHKAFQKILRFRWFLGWLIMSNSYLPVQAHLHKWKCSDIGTQKSVLHYIPGAVKILHVIYRLQIAAGSMEGYIATLNLQDTTSLPNISAVPVPIQQRRETFTLWFHSDHAAVMNECTKSLPRTKSLALWLLIEHINIYDNMQMLAQCPFSCTHLPTKKQPKRQENKREQEKENMEKCSNPLFFGLNLWYSIWTIILPASKFQIDI